MRRLDGDGMTLNEQQIEALMRLVSLTRSREPACDECLKKMAEFAEHALAGRSVPEHLEAIEHHLAVCGECNEEYSALLAALKGGG